MRRLRWMPGLALVLACRAVPAGPDSPRPEPPRPAVSGSVVEHEEGRSPRVIYHEERGGLLNTVPPPRSGARPPVPPIAPAGPPAATSAGKPAKAPPSIASPAPAKVPATAASPAPAKVPAPVASPAPAKAPKSAAAKTPLRTEPPAPRKAAPAVAATAKDAAPAAPAPAAPSDPRPQWANQVDRAIASADRPALAALADSPGAAFECGQPARAWAVADAVSAGGRKARAAEILEPLATGCDAATRLSTLERARRVVPRDDYLRWEAREAGSPREARDEQRYRRMVYDRILEDRAADRGSAGERAARLASDAGPHIVQYRDTGVALGLGWLWLEAGEAEKAATWFGHAHAWAPAQPDAIKGLAYAALRQRDFAGAVAQADKLPREVPERASIRRDALVGLAQSHYAAGQYAQALAAFESAAGEGELPRYARVTQAWCDLRLGQPERAARRFAVLYRESPDRESADGLIAATGGGRDGIPADLVATEPLRALVSTRLGEAAFRNGRYLEARALDPARWGGAGSPGAVQALLGGGFRKKTGEPGLGKMRQTLAPAADFAAPLSPQASIMVRGERARLESGTIDAGALVGSAPAGAGPTPQADTSATVNEARVVLRYEKDHAFGLSLGRGPDGGAVGGRFAGQAEFATSPAWGQAAALLFAEPVRESVLSYAGMRDPWTGTAWGGVTRKGAELRLLRLREAPWSTTVRLRGEFLDGTGVQDNSRAVLDLAGGRDLGLAGFAYSAASAYLGYEGYRRNLSGYTLGHGGYFSPQRYVRAGASFDFMTEEDRRWLVRGRVSGGWFSKREDETPLLPLAPDGRFYGGGDSRGREASIRLAAVLQATPYLQVGAMAGRSISPSYAENIGRLEVRVLFEPRRSVVAADLPAARGE
ncbi:MAG: cellulose synthase subunit BcsC-related outer membrane protein [Lysobacter sp.]|nr:cellulose synthase subunit BcsC-related outer membrane protein [Lysobacter sp.]